MAYEATIYCDLCSGIIVAAGTATAARAENRHAGGSSRAPFDLCQACVAGGATISRLAAASPRQEASTASSDAQAARDLTKEDR